MCRGLLIAVILFLGSLLTQASDPLTSGQRRVVINIPAYSLYLYEGPLRIRKYPIAVGAVVTRSILGSYRIINKVTNPTWYPPDGSRPVPPGPENPIGTRWLGLNAEGYGIHGNNNPSSIGKAVSGGCIRMYNRDVEELFTLVSVGTPVEFIYETIMVEWDPVIGRPLLTIYPDIYKLGTNTMERLKARLAPFGSLGQTNDWVLAEVIKRASGTPMPLPEPLVVRINGRDQQIQGHTFGEDPLMPALPILAQVGADVQWNTRTARLDWEGRSIAGAVLLGGEVFLPLSVLMSSFKLWAQWDRSRGVVDFWAPALRINGEIRQGNGRYHQGEVWVPIAGLGEEMGVYTYWNAERNVAMVGRKVLAAPLILQNQLYLPLSQLGEVFGVRAELHPDRSSVIIESTKVSIDRKRYPGQEGFVEDGVLWLPVSLLTHLGLEPTWRDVVGARVRLDELEYTGRLARGGEIFITHDQWLAMTGTLTQWEPGELMVFTLKGYLENSDLPWRPWSAHGKVWFPLEEIKAITGQDMAAEAGPMGGQMMVSSEKLADLGWIAQQEGISVYIYPPVTLPYQVLLGSTLEVEVINE